MAEKLSRRLVGIINDIRLAAQKQDWFGVGVAAGSLRRIADEVAESEASQEPASLAPSSSTPDKASLVWTSPAGLIGQQLSIGGEVLGQVRVNPGTMSTDHDYTLFCVDIMSATPGGGELVQVTDSIRTIGFAKMHLLARLGLPSANPEGTD